MSTKLSSEELKDLIMKSYNETLQEMGIEFQFERDGDGFRTVTKDGVVLVRSDLALKGEKK